MLETTAIVLYVNAVLWILTIMLMLHYARLRKISRRQSMEDINKNTFPAVAVVIVAQEEADKLRKHLPLFLEQNYPSEFQIIVVDIHSSDDTIKLLEEVFQMTLVEAVIMSGTEELVRANMKIALTDIESKIENDSLHCT